MRKIGVCKEEEREYELVYSNADTRIDSYTLNELLEQMSDGRIIDNIPEQRDKGQMSKKDESLLVHTVLCNLSILPISLVANGTSTGAVKELIDGKQRLSTLERFKNNKFQLSSVCPPIKMRRVAKTQKLDENGEPVIENKKIVMIPVVDETGKVVKEIIDYKIAGKFYDELPDALKKQFNSYTNLKQYVHVNYTPEEMHLQILRDNTTVKMTPAQIGVVVCGRELAEWLRSFRGSNLFLSCSTWTATQIKKSLIERCIIESFVLSVLDGQWKNGYTNNVEVFKENAAEGLLDSFKELVDDLGWILKVYPTLKEHLTNKNMNVIIAAYQKFCDLDTRYEKYDFCKFLYKWFAEIKDTTEYEIEGNAGTKQTTVITKKLSIINEECEKYMKEFGHVVRPIMEFVDEEKTSNDEADSSVEVSHTIEVNNKEIAEMENKLTNVVDIENLPLFNVKAMMLISEQPINNIDEFLKYYIGLSNDEQDELIGETELIMECVYDYSVEIPVNSPFLTEDNMLCLIKTIALADKDDVPDDVIKEWMVNFAKNSSQNVCFMGITSDKDGYILGRVSYMHSSLIEYYNKAKTETPYYNDNFVINNKEGKNYANI